MKWLQLFKLVVGGWLYIHIIKSIIKVLLFPNNYEKNKKLSNDYANIKYVIYVIALFSFLYVVFFTYYIVNLI
jgi:hypothetical protein